MLPRLGNQAEFAAHRQVSRKTVTRWKQRGLLVFTKHGLVDFAASDQALSDHGILLPQATEYRAADIDAAVEAILTIDGAELLTRAEAERLKENFSALLKKLQYERESAAVAEIEDVARVIVGEYAIVRRRLAQIGENVAPKLVDVHDAALVKEAIDAEVIAALGDLSSDAARFATAA